MNQHSPPKIMLPPEWAPHAACWLAWPADPDLWQDSLKEAQKEFTGLCHAIAPEPLRILVRDEKAHFEAKEALEGIEVTFYRSNYGDIWLRDTAPIFAKDLKGDLRALCFRFNGWGEKYVLNHDSTVNKRISELSGCLAVEQDWILEGGSIDWNDDGTCLTTRQCLLNPNRNPGLTQSDIENRLKKNFGFRKILWLDEGLINDHTDGHIDTIARFASTNKVLCMRTTKDDPQFEILEKIYSDLKEFKTASGTLLEVISIPSPGLVFDEANELMPASYLNFYIANKSVVVPTYGTNQDQKAVELISKVFPGRKTIGLAAKAILSGGGAFHCISQQQPKV